MLAKAGVVLRFNGMVYLQPQEVSELVYRVRQAAAGCVCRRRQLPSRPGALHT